MISGASRRDSTSRVCATGIFRRGCSLMTAVQACPGRSRSASVDRSVRQDRARRGVDVGSRSPDVAVIQRHLRRMPFLIRRGVLPTGMIGVETADVRTLIREDASVNLSRPSAHPPLPSARRSSSTEVNLPTFSPSWLMPRSTSSTWPRRQNSAQGRAGIMRSDLLVINKIDLAPHVGTDLGVMERDAKRMRRKPLPSANASRRHRR